MRAILLRLLGVPLSLALLVAVPVSAETGIEAVVCTGDYRPTLTVLPDINDRVLRVNTLEISGLVERVSAVEVYVDLAYDHTIAIPANDTTFATTVRLAIGTHAIRIVGIGICSGENATKDAVVTVIPWNYGFASPGAEVADQPSKVDSSDGEVVQEDLGQLSASDSEEEKATGFLGLFQAIFPPASLRETVFTSLFVVTFAIWFLPSGVLAKVGITQFIVGRRSLLAGLVPLIGLICLALGS